MPRAARTPAQVAFGQSLGRAVQKARERRNLTGEQLSRESSVGIDMIRSIESGRVASPGIYSMALLARALEVSIDSITPSTEEGDG